MSGQRTIAYLHEPAGSAYMSSPSDTTYKVPGLNISVDDITIRNALIRMGLPDDPETLESIESTFEGAISMSWTQTTPWYLNHLYGSEPSQSGAGPYDYTWTFSLGSMQGSRWFMGLDHGSGTVERELKGVVFGQGQYSINIGQDVRVSVTGFYGDEAYNNSVSPGSFSGKDADPMVFHGGSLEIPNSTTLVKPQSATLTVNSGARLQRDWDRKPADAVLGNATTTLQLDKILTGSSQLQLAYGNSSAPATSVGGVSGESTGTLKFTSAGTAALEQQLTRVTPNTYGWQDLANRDADVLENISYNVDSLTTVATSDESSAL